MGFRYDFSRLRREKGTGLENMTLKLALSRVNGDGFNVNRYEGERDEIKAGAWQYGKLKSVGDVGSV